MGKEEKLKTNVFCSIINFVRANHKDAIDRAYEYFWDGNTPDEFLGGTALSLGFINFEDWLIFDYKANDDKETFINIYKKCNTELKSDEILLLDKIKDSVLSLYEVISVSRDRRVVLKDLLLDCEFDLRDKPLTRGLKNGDIFATRLLELDGKHVMSGCVYPFSKDYKKTVLKYIEKQFGRYKRNENPEGTVKGFLKDYGDVFNIIWMDLILEQIPKKS
ncbi:MAG: hypothetical protein AB1632_03005 [Nitrospirota bacterium]